MEKTGNSHYDALSLHENTQQNTTLYMYCKESKNPSLISSFSTGNKERLWAFPCLHLAPHNSNKIRPVFYIVSWSWGSAVVQYKILSQRGGYTQFRTQLYVTFMLRQNFRKLKFLTWSNSAALTETRKSLLYLHVVCLLISQFELFRFVLVHLREQLGLQCGAPPPRPPPIAAGVQHVLHGLCLGAPPPPTPRPQNNRHKGQLWVTMVRFWTVWRLSSTAQ